MHLTADYLLQCAQGVFYSNVHSLPLLLCHTLLMSFPTLCEYRHRQVFETFACDYLEFLGESFLRADYSTQCGTAEHRLYQAYAAVMILGEHGGCWSLISRALLLQPCPAALSMPDP